MRTELDKKEEKQAKAFGAALAVLFNALLLMLFIFTAAWIQPIKPPANLGIEVDFGYDSQGSGEMNSKAQANNSNSFDEQLPMPETPQPTPQATPQTAQPAPSEVTAVTDVALEESVKATPTKQEPKKPEEKPVKKEPEQKVNPATTLGGKGTSETPQASSHGNNDAPGNVGSKTGTLNADALLGESTGKGGSALDMPGWRWESPPAVNDNSRSTGRIVFEVKIDDYGEVVSVTRVYSDVVDRSVVNLYYEAVKKLIFEQTTNAEAPPMTTGRITFIITSK